jgi:SAM-dependent methyltransferase
MQTQSAIDAQNAAFWDELCGTNAANAIGVTGNDPASLRNYDAWFIEFYPYLEKYLPFESFRGKNVLEVGLGYGTVGQKIAESGARYSALDIARGPVEGMKHRLKQSGLEGTAQQASVLKAPFADESFDIAVSIGCLHHTGDMQRAIDELARVLRPGGKIILMVYSAVGYMRWIRYPGATLRYVTQVLSGSGQPLGLDDTGRAHFDVDSKGNIAPATVAVSKVVLKRMLAPHFRGIEIARENMHEHAFPFGIPRSITMPVLGPWIGTDLYAVATKVKNHPSS